MLYTKRATTNRIRLFIRILLSTHTQCQPINNPHSRSQLLRLQTLTLEFLFVRISNLINILTKQRRLVVLASITLPLETTLSRQLHVLNLIVDIFLPLTQPLHLWIMTYISPCMSRDYAGRHTRALRHVKLHLFWCDTLFQFTHFRMLSSPSEGTGWFHVVIPHLFNVAIYDGITEFKHCFIALILVHFAFFVGNGFFDNFLFIEVHTNGFKVAFFVIFDNVFCS
mmetsp:Transcript_28320/g.37698  ORF Transcript_28320/g.37698 Transcript_28320/m.37698 type:complete len:225 (-) Transcript_28320:447-1121(-)